MAAPELSIRLLEPDEAPLLVALIRRCYDDTYINPAFYDPTFVQELLAAPTMWSVGAFSQRGALLGHMGITARAWGGNTADAGMTLVNPSHRGQGIARLVAAGLAEQALALNLCGVHDYPVTVHAATQRIAKGYGVDTGLLLANMPADVSFTSMDATFRGRSSSLIRWLPFGRAPKREVFLPERYRERIVSLYAAAKLERTLRDSRRPTISTSALETSTDDRRGILRLRVTRIGADLRPLVAAAHETGFVVAQIDLPLSDPGTPAATRQLRTLGYSFAGLLPEYREGDVLRLQWLSPKAGESAAAVLSSTATRAIEAFVLEDRLGLGSG